MLLRYLDPQSQYKDESKMYKAYLHGTCRAKEALAYAKPTRTAEAATLNIKKHMLDDVPKKSKEFAQKKQVLKNSYSKSNHLKSSNDLLCPCLAPSDLRIRPEWFNWWPRQFRTQIVPAFLHKEAADSIPGTSECQQAHPTDRHVIHATDFWTTSSSIARKCAKIRNMMPCHVVAHGFTQGGSHISSAPQVRYTPSLSYETRDHAKQGGY